MWPKVFPMQNHVRQEGKNAKQKSHICPLAGLKSEKDQNYLKCSTISTFSEYTHAV